MSLFPPIEPYNDLFLEVSDLHTIHVEEAGNPDGKPGVFVHGGPGGGIETIYRQYFDPEKWRIVLFDQRGCGKSTPFAELAENTTWDLVSDMEKIRDFLHIEKWVVFGGSWGSTLSLAYAQSHPGKVKGLILRGIFLLRHKEIQWFYQEGTSNIYPDAWENYIKPIDEGERDDFLSAYYKRLTSKNRDVRLEAAKAWSVWEGSTSKLLQDEKIMQHFGEEDFSEAFARIECHYFINKGWFDPEDQLLQNISLIRHIPGAIVQGRYDVVCPMITAWELHQAWPEAEFHIIKDSGHSMTEPGIAEKLVQLTEHFADF